MQQQQPPILPPLYELLGGDPCFGSPRVEGLATGQYSDAQQIVEDSVDEFRVRAADNPATASDLLLSLLQDTAKLLLDDVMGWVHGAGGVACCCCC